MWRFDPEAIPTLAGKAAAGFPAPDAFLEPAEEDCQQRLLQALALAEEPDPLVEEGMRALPRRL